MRWPDAGADCKSAPHFFPGAVTFGAAIGAQDG